MKKYELVKDQRTKVFDVDLYRIRALIDFTTLDNALVRAGSLGGFAENEGNLSHYDKSWVSGDAKVWSGASISGDAEIKGSAEIYGNAKISGSAVLWGRAKVSGDAEIRDNANIYGDARICDSARIYGDAKIYDSAEIGGNAKIFNDAAVYGNANIRGRVEVGGFAQIYGNVRIGDDAIIGANANISSSEHVLTLSTLGVRCSPVTFFRSETSEIIVSFNGLMFPIDDFVRQLEQWDAKSQKEARVAIELAKTYISLRSSLPFGECYECGKEFNSELLNEYEIAYCPWCGTGIPELML